MRATNRNYSITVTRIFDSKKTDTTRSPKSQEKQTQAHKASLHPTVNSNQQSSSNQFYLTEIDYKLPAKNVTHEYHDQTNATNYLVTNIGQTIILSDKKDPLKILFEIDKESVTYIEDLLKAYEKKGSIDEETSPEPLLVKQKDSLVPFKDRQVVYQVQVNQKKDKYLIENDGEHLYVSSSKEPESVFIHSNTELGMSVGALVAKMRANKLQKINRNPLNFEAKPQKVSNQARKEILTLMKKIKQQISKDI